MPTTIEYQNDPKLGNEALNTLWTAAWDSHFPRDFQPILSRNLAHVGAFVDARLVFRHRDYDSLSTGVG